MKKILTTLFAGLMISAQVMPVTVNDVCGQFKGLLQIGWEPYPEKTIYLLPGTVENTVTFVLPEFTFGAQNLGNIVLPNIALAEDGKLSLTPTTMYMDSLPEPLRAGITLLESYFDDYDGTTYYSILSQERAQVTLSIDANLEEGNIIVTFDGNALKDNNYVLPNGGFEGAWTNSEPEGWHSFNSATGVLANLIKGTDQFKQSEVVRPGTTGKNSALISTKMAAGTVPANGNCTNGRINAGSMEAADAAANYNFSDPDSVGYNTPFQGRPDSIVFWAKYQPADKNPNNEVNKARMSTIITTNARYQDPEISDYSAVKVATAEINYAATSNMGWQRISVPFTYTDIEGEPAYILTTFTTNQTPGGGSSARGKMDSIYIDDVELVYNNTLNSFSIDANMLQFNQHIATVNENYCDSCADYIAVAEGKTAQTFIGFDAAHKCIHVYVIADDFAQSGAYKLYRIEFSDSQTGDFDPIVQSVENTLVREARFKKVMINGQLFIRSNDAWYNVFGVRAK